MLDLKKFEAPTLDEVLKVVKRELGPEAIILSTKSNKSGFGLMARTSVEVTAAISEDALERKRFAESRMTPDQMLTLSTRSAKQVVKTYDVLSGARLERQQQRANNLGANLLTSQEAVSAPPRQTPTRLTQRRYIDIKDDDSPAERAMDYAVDYDTRISSQSFRNQTNQSSQANQTMTRPTGIKQVVRAPSSSPVLPPLLAELLEKGVEADLVRELGDELKIIIVREHISKPEIARLQLARIIMSRLRVAKPLGERLRLPTTPRMISFVGPTGVGKTTTIAKIAAELVINQGQKVTLATTDTYKISAVEQLQTYGNILRIPMEVCPSGESLEALAASVDSEQVILVDTAGYGLKDETRLGELRDILSSVRTEMHLCVSATTRDRDLGHIVSCFRDFNPGYLVMTKLDETTSFGSLLNLSARNLLPLSYFTMGQRVPEDMEVATKERVADLLLNISGGG